MGRVGRLAALLLGTGRLTQSCFRCHTGRMGQEGALGPSHASHAIMAIHPYGFVSVRIIATTALGAPINPEFVERIYDDGAVFLEPSLCLM